MARAANKVIAGDYKGKLIAGSFGEAFISMTMTKFLYLNKETVSNLALLDDESQISVASVALRGLVGELLLGPIGLVAAATAKRSGIYIVGIEFKDGKRSVVEVDDKRYRNLVQACIQNSKQP
ncbi:MAG: hypothetical protein UCH28_09220 [Adlercreutzia sp.]|nr:hypothetical protein [Adlercreutzia sp.]